MHVGPEQSLGDWEDEFNGTESASTSSAKALSDGDARESQAYSEDDDFVANKGKGRVEGIEVESPSKGTIDSWKY